MAQLRKVTTDAFRSNSRLDHGLPLVSLRQEILTSLVSALDSVCSAMSKLNAEVACVTVHEDSVIAVGTERGRVFLNSRREIQTDFFKFCRLPCAQTSNTNPHTKEQEVEQIKPSKGPEQCQPRASEQSNIAVLRKMVEEVFTVLYSDAAGKSNLVSVPYEWIQKNPGCVVASGLPEGVTLKRPSEYDSKTLMRILELSHCLHFSVLKRPAEDLSRESRCNSSTSAVNPGTQSQAKSSAPCSLSALSADLPPSNNMALSSFLYGMPMSSKPHHDGKPDFSPLSLLGLSKDRLSRCSGAKTMAVKDCANSDEVSRSGEHCHSPPSIHISKRLLFSIVHEKSEKWDTFIKETEDINTLRECVQILFNSRYAEALGLDHMVPVPYRKIACDPGAVEIVGIPDQIPFKRPCTYGVPKLKRILDERHGIRFIVRRMFDDRIFTAAGKIVREDVKHDLEPTSDESFSDQMSAPTVTELLSNPQSSRSTSECVSPLAECDSGPPGDCISLKRIKSEPPDNNVLQVTLPEASSRVEETPEPVETALCLTVAPSISRDPPSAPSQPQCHTVKAPRPNTPLPSVRPASEVGTSEEDIGEMILQLRRQVDSLFSTKYAEALGLSEPCKVPYSKFQMYPEELYVTGLPPGISLRRPNCFGVAKLKKILAVSSDIQFIIKRSELLTEQVKSELPSVSDSEQEVKKTAVSEDATAYSKRPGFSECLESKLSRIDLANTLREQVQDLFNRKYGEALGIKYPVQVPYKRIKNNPDSIIIEGLPPGIPFRKPCTFGSQNLERILAVADKINFTITKPFQGLIPKPAPRRVTLMKKAYASITDEENVSRLGEKGLLREQVRELFNTKYGEALGQGPVLVPYKLIKTSPDAVQIQGLPDNIPFRNPNSYDVSSLERILQSSKDVCFNIKPHLLPAAEVSAHSCNAGADVYSNQRKRKRVQESSQVPPSLPERVKPANEIPVMQWPMYTVDYSGVNVSVSGKVNN
ncbi:general transcription factor II-I repeat domain-containing protein 1 [Boleophthalmus pectinirostris]|uniref:general transcription factor II-I repeat domain-containing protein 1 n=1 Tax=Boleophthalmus pectinirostris TaxID=150288 RepID=UPI00242A96EF|nr:general transcription factor II-I repeat domain-containing protein 1 [Boleophthalmus pectinirostris]